MVAVPLMIALVNGPDRLAGHDVLLAAVERVLPLLLRADVPVPAWRAHVPVLPGLQQRQEQRIITKFMCIIYFCYVLKY